MFSKVFVESEIKDHPQARKILERFSQTPISEIERIDDVFGRVKKPYLQKRDSLQLFLGKKRGNLVKLAPDAYGLAGEPHYYFIHAYNCIYECEYCYLQGYFHSPDIVLFLNHDEIIDEMKTIAASQPDTKVWFHAGEFSDSLALTHLTGELELYHNFIEETPNAVIELRTKSVNTTELEKLPPHPRLITSFSLSPKDRAKKTDLKTPPLETRLKAMSKLEKLGHPMGIHLDPIIHEDSFEETYQQLFKQITEYISPSSIEYLSMGVVRFTSNVFHQVKKNYPKSELLAAEFATSFDGKVRYPRPFRLWLLGKIKDLAMAHGFTEKQIYQCME